MSASARRSPFRALLACDWDVLLSGMVVQLVPWALGYSDPVRDRVEARKREGAGETSCVNPNDE